MPADLPSPEDAHGTPIHPLWADAYRFVDGGFVAVSWLPADAIRIDSGDPVRASAEFDDFGEWIVLGRALGSEIALGRDGPVKSRGKVIREAIHDEHPPGQCTHRCRPALILEPSARAARRPLALRDLLELNPHYLRGQILEHDGATWRVTAWTKTTLHVENLDGTEERDLGLADVMRVHFQELQARAVLLVDVG